MSAVCSVEDRVREQQPVEATPTYALQFRRGIDNYVAAYDEITRGSEERRWHVALGWVALASAEIAAWLILRALVFALALVVLASLGLLWVFRQAASGPKVDSATRLSTQQRVDLWDRCLRTIGWGLGQLPLESTVLAPSVRRP